MASKSSTTNYINYYCERGSDLTFLAEPINFFTNFCFIVAALIALNSLKKNNLLNIKSFDLIFLSFVLAIIGLGSSAFHSIPSQATLLMDIIPIAIFIHFYLPVFFTRILGFKIWQSLLVLVLFIGVGLLSEKIFDAKMLNGTIMYAPTYVMLLLMCGVIFITKKTGAKYLFITTLIWTISLFFRTFDANWCSATNHIGTHFMWHILNSIVLYRCLNLLIIKVTKKI